MTPQELSMLALWTWFRNNPNASFQEFFAVFRRAKAAIKRALPAIDRFANSEKEAK